MWWVFAEPGICSRGFSYPPPRNRDWTDPLWETVERWVQAAAAVDGELAVLEGEDAVAAEPVEVSAVAGVAAVVVRDEQWL